jgi:PAS domain-containing protein
MHCMSDVYNFDSFPGAVTICTPEGIIEYMNSAAETLLAEHGGRALIGSNVLDCHPAPAREKLEGLMRDRRSNTSTSEKNGIRRLVYQFPLYDNGGYSGYGEISFEIPIVIPNFIRE